MKDVLSGAQGAIVVRIYGPDFATLRTQAEATAALFASVPGVVDLKVEPQIWVPQVEVRMRSERAALHGVTAAQVRRAVSVLVAGTKVGEVFAAQQQVGVVVWGQPSVRRRATPGRWSSTAARLLAAEAAWPRTERPRSRGSRKPSPRKIPGA